MAIATTGALDDWAARVLRGESVNEFTTVRFPKDKPPTVEAGATIVRYRRLGEEQWFIPVDPKDDSQVHPAGALCEVYGPTPQQARMVLYVPQD